MQRRERLDLADLTSEVLLIREPQLSSAGLELRCKLEAAPAEGDPRLIERLVANLIDNAISHNTPGGHVELATGVRDRRPFISVSNTGPTIQPDDLHRLFEPFQRLGGARTGHNNGHGLGLSIVQAVADAHDAQLSAQPRPGGGLQIEVSFPHSAVVGSGAALAGAPA